MKETGILHIYFRESVVGENRYNGKIRIPPKQLLRMTRVGDKR